MKAAGIPAKFSFRDRVRNETLQISTSDWPRWDADGQTLLVRAFGTAAIWYAVDTTAPWFGRKDRPQPPLIPLRTFNVLVYPTVRVRINGIQAATPEAALLAADEEYGAELDRMFSKTYGNTPENDDWSSLEPGVRYMEYENLGNQATVEDFGEEDSTRHYDLVFPEGWVPVSVPATQETTCVK